VTERVRTGGCLCGQVTVTARGEPNRVGICHCMTCRKTTGSVMSVFAIFPKDRVVIEGRYACWGPDREGKRCFCPTCGSRVVELSGDEIEIMAGAFDEPNSVVPSYETWVVRREHWLPETGFPTHPRNRGEA
jgi:hypothetical protein